MLPDSRRAATPCFGIREELSLDQGDVTSPGHQHVMRVVGRALPAPEGSYMVGARYAEAALLLAGAEGNTILERVPQRAALAETLLQAA
jgi:hypothetical protein